MRRRSEGPGPELNLIQSRHYHVINLSDPQIRTCALFTSILALSILLNHKRNRLEDIPPHALKSPSANNFRSDADGERSELNIILTLFLIKKQQFNRFKSKLQKASLLDVLTEVTFIQDPCCTASKWTVDPRYLLQKLSVRISYCTVTIDNTSSFSVDNTRSIKGEEIIFVFPGKYLFIVLVDHRGMEKNRKTEEPNRFG
ncbi:hypothetical protein LXL04_001582 [Taraxacum kok-saghyz]